MTTTSKIVLGILGAAAAGVIVGLMIAPEKGEDFRRKIKDTASDWADNVSDLFNRGKEELSKVKRSASEGYNRAKESVS